MNQKLDDKVINKKKRSYFISKISTIIYHAKLLEIRKKLMIISKKYESSFVPQNSKNLISLLKRKCNIDLGCTPMAILIPSSDYWDYDYRGKIYLENLKNILIKDNIKYIDFTNISNKKKMSF